MKLPASIFGRNDVAIDLVPKKRGRKIGWKKNYRHTLRGKGSSRFVSGSTNKKSIDLSDSSDDSDCEELLFPDNTLDGCNEPCDCYLDDTNGMCDLCAELEDE